MDYQISYVIPTLNSEKTLESTIISLKQQENVNVRIIVVDGGSIDGTLEICRKWNIENHFVPPGNIYEAINYGLSLSDTEWLGYINSDDILYSNVLIELIKRGELQEADIVYGVCDFIDADGRFLYSFIPPKPRQLASVMKTRTCGLSQQTAIFRASWYKKNNGFDTKYRYSSDYDFYARSVIGKAKFAMFESCPVACFRLHDNQLSYQFRNELLLEGSQIVDNVLSKPSIYDILLTAYWRMSNLRDYLLKILRYSLILQKK
jgi:glycosyltransferase involved in cell wall biosynthesis